MGVGLSEVTFVGRKYLLWVVGDTPPGAYTSVKGATTRVQPELVVWYGWFLG